MCLYNFMIIWLQTRANVAIIYWLDTLHMSFARFIIKYDNDSIGANNLIFHLLDVSLLSHVYFWQVVALPKT